MPKVKRATLLQAAKAGQIDRILELAEEGDPGGDEGVLLAYKWLLVAMDFGHDADDFLDALHTGGPLAYDDDESREALIHFELGLSYLLGEDGLPIDPALARSHLETAHDLELHVTTDLPKSFDEVRKRLGPEGSAVFDAVFAP